MKIKLFFIIAFLFSFQLSSQTNCVELTNKISGEKYLIKENARVKIVVANKGKEIGRFKIVDSLTISINDKVIKLSDIYKIKNRSIGKAIGSGFLIGVGTLVLSFGAIILIADPAGALIAASSGLTSSVFGIILPDINNGHKNDKWNYKIISVAK